MKESLDRAEINLIQQLKSGDDQSGSCSLILLLDSHKATFANVGDSRAFILSTKGVIQVTSDHKPETYVERDRIHKAGGKVYRQRVESSKEYLDTKGNTQTAHREVAYGPYRVEPGGLSVSRSLGDIRSKIN